MYDPKSAEAVWFSKRKGHGAFKLSVSRKPTAEFVNKLYVTLEPTERGFIFYV